MNDHPAATRRIRMLVQYDGAAWHGLQYQPGFPTVQGALEDALLRMLGRPVRINAAGRTDAGVHALAMPMHFDTDHPIPPDKVAVAIAQFLPDTISVLRSDAPPPGWDARRSAVLRWYRYQVYLSSVRHPLGPRAWRVFRRVDLAAIEEALPLLAGDYDFRGFRAAECQAQRTQLTLEQATLTRSGDLLAFDFKCRSFLHHMVRFMVGTLVSMGMGQIDLHRLLRIRDEGERPQLALCAPPEGLCLMGVAYHEEERQAMLAARPALPSF